MSDDDRAINEDWDYWDYIEHGVFPGIDDYIRAMGGCIDPWTGEEREGCQPATPK